MLHVMTEQMACYLHLEMSHIKMAIVKLEMKGQIKHTVLWDIVLEYFLL